MTLFTRGSVFYKVFPALFFTFKLFIVYFIYLSEFSRAHIVRYDRITLALFREKNNILVESGQIVPVVIFFCHILDSQN